MHWLKMRAWSPYLVGAMIGVLSWFAFASVDKPLGTSTTFVNAAGVVEQTVAPAHVAASPYFSSKGIKVDWQMLLVLGIALGALASAWLSGDWRIERVPDLWRRRFGANRWLRYGAAFAGGAILLLGARIADGCTSGHGISGSLQLAVSGWVFFAAVFVSGVAAALALYGKVRTDV